MSQQRIHLRLQEQLQTMYSAQLNRNSPRLLSLVSGQQLSDSDVAHALVAGEPWATAETWYRFAPMVLRMAQRCLGSKAEAEDLTQEVFTLVFRKAATLRDPNCLRSFVYSFAVRKLKTELRKKKLRSWASLESIADSHIQGPDVETRDQLRVFYQLLDRLSPRERLIFILRRVEAMTAEQVADHMSISVSTVKRSMARASDKLSVWIDAEPGLAGLLDKHDETGRATL